MASTVTAQIEALIARDKMDCLRAQAHLYGLLPPHDMDVWDVDLEVPRFTSKGGEALHVTSNVQLVGTWSRRDSSWVWADRNSSVSSRGYAMLMEKLDAIEELRPLRSQARFETDRESAVALSTWCARRAGFAGAWPGPTGDVDAMLAIDPVVWPGSKVETTGRQWCSFCGKARPEVKALVAGPGVNACDECIGMLQDIVEESQPRSSADIPTMPPCAFCAERTTRIFTPYAAMCLACIELAGGALSRGG